MSRGQSFDGPGGEFGGISINGHEARVETTGFGNTGVVEAGLGNGVVLLLEYKGNSITDLCRDSGGVKDELVGSADDHFMISRGNGSWSSGSRERCIGSDLLGSRSGDCRCDR